MEKEELYILYIRQRHQSQKEELTLYYTEHMNTEVVFDDNELKWKTLPKRFCVRSGLNCIFWYIVHLYLNRPAKIRNRNNALINYYSQIFLQRPTCNYWNLFEQLLLFVICRITKWQPFSSYFFLQRKTGFSVIPFRPCLNS